MNDDLDLLLDEDVDDIIPKKKGDLDDDLDLDEDLPLVDDEDPFMADLGYGFGGDDEEF